MKLQRRCFFLCLHSLGNSFLVLSVARCGLHMIKYFSLKHSLHDLVDVVYGSAFANTFQFMVCGMFLSFNVQIYWLSAVLFFLFLSLKELLWLLYLVLKRFSVMPTYCSVLLLSCLLTVAWYTIPFTRQLPFNGHVFLFLQLQLLILLLLLLVFFFLIIALLWFEMIWFMFGMHL